MPMATTTVEQLRKYLNDLGVPDGSYVIQELGIGEVEGIGFLDGAWCTYYSERGKYRNVKRFATEALAIENFLNTLRPQLAEEGIVLPD